MRATRFGFAVLASLVLLAACGGTTLDYAQLETRIEEEFLANFDDVETAEATCPRDEDPGVGDSIICTVDVNDGEGSRDVQVTIEDEEFNVTIETVE